MAFDLHSWLGSLTEQLRCEFGQRILFIGLQGSYQRGEATPTSDVDVILVLDTLSLADLQAYRRIVHGMEYHEKACGFVCGRDELAAWSALDLFHLLHDTRPLYGELAPLTPALTDADIRAGVRLAVGNVHHATCHRYLYSDDLSQRVDRLASDYKAAFYVLQQLVYLEEHRYVPTRRELESHLAGLGHEVHQVASQWEMLRNDRQARPDHYYELLINWSGEVLRRMAVGG